MGSKIDALKVEDYNLPLEYPTINEDNLSKYSYNSWCPDCKETSKSQKECIEPCRKKSKEMLPNIRRFYENEEYENMGMEYGWNESKNHRMGTKNVNETQVHQFYDCCSRIRSNLCELPTSYIRNSTNQNSRMSDNDKDFVECLENRVKSYDQTVKYLKYPDEKYEKLRENSVQFDTRLQKGCENLNGIQSHYKQIVHLQDERPNNYKEDKYNMDNFSDYHNTNSISYETTTYFDKQEKMDNFSKIFTEEIDDLKRRLQELRSNAYRDNLSAEIVAKSLQQKDDESDKKETIVRMRSSPRVVRRNRSKIIRMKQRGRLMIPIRIRRSRNVLPKTPVESEKEAEETESDYSDSDESIKEAEEEVQVPAVPPECLDKDEQQGTGDSNLWPIRESLFPNVPPYILFNAYNEEMRKLPIGKKFFKWKLSTITPILVRKVVSNSGFAMVRSEFTRESNQWLGTWGKHIKSPMFKTLKESQKLNHFPGTFQLGRKDRLWRNFQRMINTYGYKEFGFLPHTYVLPHELKQLKFNWENKSSSRDWWIIKPPASARGVGIKVINKWNQLPKKTSLVVQKYISNPYLINGSKFDLRLYVLVTSFHPLRVYLYTEGLVRFASVKYSNNAKDIKEKYMHLTNYSINKLSSNYTANEDAEVAQGHKWTITKLMEYLNENGVDVRTLWRNLENLVVKTMIACESPITELCQENMNTRYNCYELFGIDVLLDSKLKPWLLEVNISPSLHSSSPLDEYVKGPMVQSLFNMAQFHFPTKLETLVKSNLKYHEPKLYTNHLTQKEIGKHVKFESYVKRDDYLESILESLTGDDVRHLIQAEDELRVRDKFKRVFPTPTSYKFMEFMEIRYYNRLFDAWETKYGYQREEGIKRLSKLCNERVHLKGAALARMHKNGQIMIHGAKPASARVKPSQKNQTKKTPETNPSAETCIESENKCGN